MKRREEFFVSSRESVRWWKWWC